MPARVVVLSIPQVRRRDVTPGAIASLDRMCARGALNNLAPAFPSLSATAFASLVTGTDASGHGAIASAFFDRAAGKIVGPFLRDAQIGGEKLWESAARVRPGCKTMAWFAPNTEGAAVDFWAGLDADGELRTQPEALADSLTGRFGAFPKPLAWPASAAPRLEMTAWLLKTAAFVLNAESPDLAIVRVPHLGHVARRYGPDSRDAARAIVELDRVLGPFLSGTGKDTALIAATETVATPVSEPIDVNRILRELNALRVRTLDDGASDIDIDASKAFAVAEHQVAHVYVNQKESLPALAAAFAGEFSDGIGLVLHGPNIARMGLAHERSGDLVLIAEPHCWFRGDWWRNPKEAPRSTIRPSGLDSHSLRLVSDSARVHGSIGAPMSNARDVGMIACSLPLAGEPPEGMRLRDVARFVRGLLARG